MNRRITLITILLIVCSFVVMAEISRTKDTYDKNIKKAIKFYAEGFKREMITTGASCYVCSGHRDGGTACAPNTNPKQCTGNIRYWVSDGAFDRLCGKCVNGSFQ